MMLITTLVVSFLVCCVLEFRNGYSGVVSGLQAQARRLCLSLQPGNHSSLTAPHLQHTANLERHDQFVKQHLSHEILMMGIVMLETC